MTETLTLASLVLAAIPCALFLANLFVYKPLPRAANSHEPQKGVSVLIPARNEQANIGNAIDAALRNTGIDFEIIVLDDHSTDATPAIVRRYSNADSRVRLEYAPPLPPGWCGKQHACHALSRMARYPWLVFIDADVRLAPGALSRLVKFMRAGGLHLASGVPRQSVVTFNERLLIPLVHFLLLGYLPMHWARKSKHPAFAAGCGQLFIAQAEAYRKAGGHALVRASLHDGLKLPRAFRRAGLRTDLFDATDLASCRMYQKNSEVWTGLGKNAVEGLGAPGAIVPMTLLLLGGNVLPWLMLAVAESLTTRWLALAAILLSLVPRLVGAWRFRQPWSSVPLHPVGITALLAIQWQALARHLLGKPATWRGRSYPPAVVHPVGAPSPSVVSPR